MRELLKRVGARPDIVRRAAVATYEAEMNVVIHARRGSMKVLLEGARLDVEVADHGPGIGDIGMAMKEGFSTASPAARDLGFGAGMGLPNIRRNTDEFTIDSTLGDGTRLRFTIYLGPQGPAGRARNSIRIAADKCRGCLRCLEACPTGALRVRGDTPEILEHLCIDDAECLRSCEARAFTIDGADWSAPARGAVLVVPPTLLVQFGRGIQAPAVVHALLELGYAQVYVTSGPEDALRRAVARYAGHETKLRPVISPVCPAVVNLIQLKYPSLCEQVAPFLSPMEAAQVALTGVQAVFVVDCPAQYTSLTSGDPWTSGEAVSSQALLSRGLCITQTDDYGRDEIRSRSPAVSSGAREVLEVSGVDHVMKILDRLETDSLGDIEVLELFLCDQGCFGSPLLREEPFVARRRWEGTSAGIETIERVIRRASPLLPRPGIRLDPDMGAAIRKLARMDALVKAFPGKDCRQCGAPSCEALAEDIVMGRADQGACIHLSTRERQKP